MSNYPYYWQNHSGNTGPGPVPPLPRGLDPLRPFNWSPTNPAPPPNGTHYLQEFKQRRDEPIFTNPATFGPPMVLPATNPTSIIATDSKIHGPRQLPVTLVSSKQYVLDSRDRDLTRYASANNFVMRLPDVPEGIQSVSRAGGPVGSDRRLHPRGTYVVLSIGDLPVAFTAQPVDPKSPFFNSVSQESFGQFVIADELYSGRPYLHWSRTSGRRAIKTFAEPLAKLSQLHIALWSRTSTNEKVPYPLPAESTAAPLSPMNNILLRFEIICQQ